ncbi:unnamed protein product, partial [Meganyctiphanes norvegica]
GEVSQGEDGRHTRGRVRARAPVLHFYSKNPIVKTSGYREDPEDCLAECEPSFSRSRNNSSTSYQCIDSKENVAPKPAVDRALAEHPRVRHSRSLSYSQGAEIASRMNSTQSGHILNEHPRRRSRSSSSQKRVDRKDTSPVRTHYREIKQNCSVQPKQILSKPQSVRSHSSSVPPQYQDINPLIADAECKLALIKPLSYVQTQEMQQKNHQSNLSQEYCLPRLNEEIPKSKYKDSGICTDVENASHESDSIPGVVIAHLDDQKQARLLQKAQRVAQLKNKFFEDNSEIFSYLSDSSKLSSSSERNNSSTWWNNKQNPNNQQINDEITTGIYSTYTRGATVSDSYNAIHRNAITPDDDFSSSSQLSSSFSENQLPGKAFIPDSEGYVFGRTYSTETYLKHKADIHESTIDSIGIRKSASFDSNKSSLQSSLATDTEYFLPKNAICLDIGSSPMIESDSFPYKGIIIPHKDFMDK